MIQSHYPRVLFITPCAFNKITGGGITFSNLFRGWPADRLATLTGDRLPVTRDVCCKYYFLTGLELNKIPPFSMVWKDRPNTPSGPGPEDKPNFGGKAFGRGWIFGAAKQILGEAGIPDRGRLSPELRSWLRAYKPEVIYTILGTPGYMDLISKISREFNLPVVIHLMDDGVTDPVRRGLFGGYLRYLYRRKLRGIIKQTSLAIAICELMADTYTRRYGIPFIHFQNTVDINKWHPEGDREFKINGTPRLVYIGSVLEQAQAQSLENCCAAVKLLNEQGDMVKLDIYTPVALMQRASVSFLQHENIRIQDAPEDDRIFFKILRESDLLLLPVNFDEKSVQYIRYSMPTKVPSYLISSTPILVYGPAGVAQVEYARERHWGHVVDQEDVSKLAQSIRKLLHDAPARMQFSSNALTVVRENHGADRVRTRFQNALVEVCRDF